VSSIEKTEHGTYRVRYRTPDGRSRSKSFKRRADADAFAATVETSKLQGTYTDPSLGKTRFGEWAKHVQDSRINLAPTTRARDDSYFRSLILPYFADEPLARVNPLQVQKWVSALVAEEYAPGTIRKAYQLLSAVFDAAVNSDLIPVRRAGGSSCRRTSERRCASSHPMKSSNSPTPSTRGTGLWCSPAPTPDSAPASCSA
jgi:hypothetical protein